MLPRTKVTQIAFKALQTPEEESKYSNWIEQWPWREWKSSAGQGLCENKKQGGRENKNTESDNVLSLNIEK